MDLHVGRGTSRGALTVFPIWNGDGGPRSYVTTTDDLVITECDGGPSVPGLIATHGGTKPALVLEVTCVEQGRWGGGRRQDSRGRRATPFVRSGAYVTPAGRDRQGEVWRRVGTYLDRVPANATGSLVGHLDAAAAAVRRHTRGLKPLPGQAGVVVAIAGQPVMAEVFDDPRTLREQFDSIVAAAGLDALGRPPMETPSRRARRLVERLEKTRLTPTGEAGLGQRLQARSEYVDAAGLTWQRRVVHLRVTNVRHPILVGA